MDITSDAVSLYAIILGAVGLIVAFAIFKSVSGQPDGNERMQEIAGSIYEGAMAFLKREYRILIIFVLVVFGLLAWNVALETGIAFLTGAICSALAGYLGMQSATKANVRTSEAARSEGEGAALLVAFNGGAGHGPVGRQPRSARGRRFFSACTLTRKPQNTSVALPWAPVPSPCLLGSGGGIYTKAAGRRQRPGRQG